MTTLIPSDATVLGDLTVAGSITAFSNQVPTDSYGHLKVVTRTPVLEFKSIFGVSSLREEVTTTGSGAVTSTPGVDEEIHLDVTTANSSAQVSTTERGRYIAGYSSEMGIALRFHEPGVGEQVCKWGYFDADNGFYFKTVGSAVNVGYMRDGIEEIFPQSSWNVDKMDGTGPSGITLDLTHGIIYRILFSWYGYGAINWLISTTNANGQQVSQVIHRWSPQTTTSTKTPNLPISVLISSGAINAPFGVAFAGRQFSLHGPNVPIFRVNSAYGSLANVSTTFRPIMSIKKKGAYVSCGVRLNDLDLAVTDPIFYQIRSGCTLTGAAFGALQDQPSSETSCELDQSATAATGGVVIYSGVIGSGGFRVLSSVTVSGLSFQVRDNLPVTLLVRAVTGTVASVAYTFRWAEEF